MVVVVVDLLLLLLLLLLLMLSVQNQQIEHVLKSAGVDEVQMGFVYIMLAIPCRSISFEYFEWLLF